jgi:hypothetical protein
MICSATARGDEPMDRPLFGEYRENIYPSILLFLNVKLFKQFDC